MTSECYLVNLNVLLMNTLKAIYKYLQVNCRTESENKRKKRVFQV